MQAIDLIVVPQGVEYQAVCRGLLQAKVRVRVIAVPIGDRHAKAVLANYSPQLASARGILIMGLCGGIGASHKVGDGVVVQNCCNLNSDWLNLDDRLTTTIQHQLSVDVVDGLTSDRVITHSTEKLKLATEYQADIVEMEGYGYVSQLQQQNKAVAMLRVVSDDHRGDIPDISQAIDDRGQLRTRSLAIALCKQPVAAIRLIRGSLIGLKALQRMTARLFTEDHL